MDLLVPDETELALLGGQDTLFECGVKTTVATKAATDTKFARPPNANELIVFDAACAPPADPTVEFSDKPNLGQQTVCAKFVISVKIRQYN